MWTMHRVAGTRVPVSEEEIIRRLARVGYRATGTGRHWANGIATSGTLLRRAGSRPVGVRAVTTEESYTKIFDRPRPDGVYLSKY